MKIIAALSLSLAALTGPAVAETGDGAFLVREQGRTYRSLQKAVDAIGDGTGTIIIAPGVYDQCATQAAGRIAYVAREPGRAIFDGGVCEGKAALVLAGREARVEGLVFRSMRVPERNGAGIRIERGDLLVLDSMFRDSENGILSADDAAGTIRIERSTFSGLGGCADDYGCSHSLYVGAYGRLIVIRSRFERGMGGHYVKSRAPVLAITNSSFDDSHGTATNYMIDLSNGATGAIVGNVFVQGADKENYSAFVMVAAEGADNSSQGLRIADNEAGFAPGVVRSTSFVAVAGADDVIVEANRLAPGIRPLERR